VEDDQAKLYVELTESLLGGMEDLFRLAYTKYGKRLTNTDDIYQSFVVALAQTMGRHIAAFPDDQRDQAALEALQIQEEMTALCITATTKAELEKAAKKDPGVKYDLSLMKPEGNA
jgi:hypothetical protein